MNYWDSDIVAIDTETTGLDWKKDRVFGVSITWPGHNTYFDVRQEPGKYAELRDRAPHLKKIVNQNIKYDAHMLMNDDIILPLDRCHDTCMRAALIDEHLLHYNLNALGQKYLNRGKEDTGLYEKLAELYGGKPTREAQMKNLHKAPAKLVSPYAIGDTELAMDLFLFQEKLVLELEEVYALECRLFPHVFRLEREGLRVDVDVAVQRADMVTSEIDRIRKDLDKLAGFPVNPNPSGSIYKLFEPKQDKNGIWWANDGTPLGTTNTGKASLGREELAAMKHPAATMVLEARKLMKARDTFINGHILGHVDAYGYVHPSINQTKTDKGSGTGTGRISYQDPALQQIPNRDKKTASIVRPIFIPDLGQGWTYGDLDQHELRIFHHFVKDPSILAKYKEDPDMDGHQAVADLIDLPRNATAISGMANAKQMNLAMIFNMGGGELASVMGMPYTWDSFTKNGKEHRYKKAGSEAQAMIDKYYAMVPGVKRIAKQATSIAKSRGYVKTLKGRRIHFPGGKFTYKASGLVYQGSAGDLNKENICRICEYLESESPEARLLLNVHDEYSISMPFGFEKHLHELKAEIQRRPELRVPLRINFSELSSNWWDATNAPAIS